MYDSSTLSSLGLPLPMLHRAPEPGHALKVMYECGACTTQVRTFPALTFKKQQSLEGDRNRNK